jgi:membrane protease YdiL (CAAX protease family)
MGLLAWIVAPMLAGAIGGPDALPRALLVTFTLGLVWQFVLTLVLVYGEQRTLRWSVVREVLWLRAPRSPRTGRRGGWMWLAVPLFGIAFFAVQVLVPSLPHPAVRDAGAFLGSPAGHSLLHGSWGWFALIAIMLIFNTVLGEELLFRGLLLPRMNGAFGRWDWLANAILFAAYHVHQWWSTPSNVLAGLIFAYPSKRYRSSLMGIAVHSAQTVFILAIALELVLK